MLMRLQAYDRVMGGRQIRGWAWVGFAAQVVFVVIWIAAGFWQGPRYSVVADSISDLYAVTAPAGVLVAVVISLCGLATILFAWLAVWPSLRAAGRSATIGSILLGLSIYGLGNLLAPFARVGCRIADQGCSPADQLANAGGQLDAITSIPGILFFIAAVFFVSAAMVRTADWRELAQPTRRLAIALVVLLVATVAASAIGGTGLMTRLFAFSGAAAIAGLAWEIGGRGPLSRPVDAPT
jgi:hypothetical protein